MMMLNKEQCDIFEDFAKRVSPRKARVHKVCTSELKDSGLDFIKLYNGDGYSVIDIKEDLENRIDIFLYIISYDDSVNLRETGDYLTFISLEEAKHGLSYLSLIEMRNRHITEEVEELRNEVKRLKGESKL